MCPNHKIRSSGLVAVFGVKEVCGMTSRLKKKHIEAEKY